MTSATPAAPGPPSVGIIGAGQLGSSLAQLLRNTSYPTSIAGRSARLTRELVAGYLPGIEAVALREVWQRDLLILALPIHQWRLVDPALVAGRIVVDAMNYSPLLDGVLADFDAQPSSSEVLAAAWPQARVVRTFNHIAAGELTADARPVGEPDRRALAVAGDDGQARATVAELVEAMGFDAVDAGALAAARQFAPGTRIFGGRFTAAGLRAELHT